MKSLAILLLLPFLALGQMFPPGVGPDAYKPVQYSTLLNGTSRYWSKASPQNMDLNGPERLANSTFETDTSNWTVRYGTYQTTTAVKYAGSKSCLLIANGAGAAITSAPVADVTTNKGTGEAWVYCFSAASTKSIKLWFLKQDSTLIDSVTQTVTALAWTKLVRNKQWDGTQTGIMVRVGFNGGTAGDSLCIDSPSLTQAKDLLYQGVFYLPALVGSEKDIGGYRPAAQASGYEISIDGTNKYTFCLISSSFGGSNVGAVTPTVVAGQWLYVAGTYQRDGNLTAYLNAVAGTPAAISGIGKIIPTTPILSIGVSSADGSTKFPGSIGSIQVILYDALPSDAPSQIKRIASTWRTQGLPKQYPQGQIVLNIDWRTPIDKSGNQGTLTGTGSPPYRLKIR